MPELLSRFQEDTYLFLFFHEILKLIEKRHAGIAATLVYNLTF